MENLKFNDVLKSYEEKDSETKYEIVEKPANELAVINNDVKRTTFLSVNKKDKAKVKMLKHLTYYILSSIPVNYVQGMSEVSSVFIVYYFSSDYDQFSVKPLDVSSKEDESMELKSLKSENKREFESFKEGVQDKIEKCRIVLINVFNRKFLPLVDDNFKLYKSNVEVFVEMMKKRNVNIEETSAYMFMGSVFTFFFRDVTTIEDAYKMFEIVLSCPLSTLFLLSVIYYDTISKKEQIEYVDDNLYQSVVLLEKEFIETQEKMKQKRSSFFSRNAILIGGAVGFAVAVVLYKINKRDPE
ncbi:hypothetical protein NBO_62g0004 [Nosema bombycis CQ1]|uniref:Rab-GAP TBC domain-containing protein n=1 Tax=Nosema bombycis (strain CQ1 / CVCC 102059) TaxID=578461 RepID=R0M6T4_NOSB1|nr:hypothetical protein NBO_62g0004 [Nosema bombycis CQ1]|eukprot:EOB13714.1 hypothetical protein NBO_62g0004 [Nosema bombycis CQ1]